MRDYRRKVQLVWQHSALALNPRMQVVDVVGEPLRIKGSHSKMEIRELTFEMLARVGLRQSLFSRTPFRLSGGQRQRVALARALVLQPLVLILDEAFAGLDLPLQDEMTALLLDLKESLSLTYLFITHDLRRAALFADEIAVMEKGRIVEQGSPTTLLARPSQQATRELLDAAMLT
jgi:ABC-type dipeptide/oligopeptide/nickel transport system ATPase subunit